MRLLALALSVALLSACGPMQSEPQSAQYSEAQKSRMAGDNIHFTTNAERDNIVKRLKLTANPGLVMYCVLLNDAGQPIQYVVMQGKLTSSGKRLHPRTDVGFFNSSENSYTTDAPSDEGTYGESGPYVYGFDVNGSYIQWSGQYYCSDHPVHLRIQPLIISTGGKRGTQ